MSRPSLQLCKTLGAAIFERMKPFLPLEIEGRSVSRPAPSPYLPLSFKSTRTRSSVAYKPIRLTPQTLSPKPSQKTSRLNATITLLPLPQRPFVRSPCRPGYQRSSDLDLRPKPQAPNPKPQTPNRLMPAVAEIKVEGFRV